MDDQQLFSVAIDFTDADQRAAFLDKECSDQEQRRRLEQLLAAHDRSLNLSQLPTQPPETTAHTAHNQPIEQIGPYRILEPLGEGGMGTVFMAQQEEPVRRRVAIKVIKPGMDSRQIIARFEAERQALALMNHEHIAKVFDAGATGDGQPYFVMELVPGVPITEYCDQHRLNTEQRLNLVIPVCQAIQHAHQKGVIHRDIKPSNVLVAEGDSGPVPKVIDFGLAKALQQQLTDSSVFTQIGQIMGTLEYMSPEQAELNVTDIDTRTDVYALGVLLYELLTGSTPIGRARLKAEAFDRILQLIREEQPPRPSTRLSDSHDALPSLAAQRSAEPRRLSQILRGDLDAIVMKALDKDRSRRYDSATGLAADIQRYLMHEPIDARAPSARYRLRKLAQKYRAAVLAAGAFVALLLVATVLSSWLAVRATRAETLARTAEEQAHNDAAIAKAVTEFLQEDLLAQANPLESTDRDLKLRTVLDRAAEKVEQRFPDQPLVEASIRYTLAKAYAELSENDAAKEQIKRSTELRQRELGKEHLDTLESMGQLGSTYYLMGQYDEAVDTLTTALDGYRRVSGAEDPQTLVTANNLAMVYYMSARLDEAAELMAENLKISRRVMGENDEDTIAMALNLGGLYEATGRYEEALPLLKEAYSSFLRVHGKDHPHTLHSAKSVARIYRSTGRLEEAETLFKTALDRYVATLGDEHLETQVTRHDLGTIYQAQGRYSDAEKQLSQAADAIRIQQGDTHPATAQTMASLAALYINLDRYGEAVPLLEEATELLRSIVGDDHPTLSNVMNNLGTAYRLQGHFDKAQTVTQQAYESLRNSMGEHHQRTLLSLFNLGAVYHARGRYGEADQHYRNALESQREALGAEHVDTLKMMNQLAVLYQDQGKLAEAEPLQSESLTVSRRVLGDAHPVTLDSMNSLALLHRRQGRFAESEELLDELISNYRGQVEAEDFVSPLRFGKSLTELSICRIAQDRFEDAHELAAEAVTWLEKTEHWRLHVARSILGESMMRQANFAKAEPMLLDAWKALDENAARMPQPYRHQVRQRTLKSLVQLYTDWGKSEEAEEWETQITTK